MKLVLVRHGEIDSNIKKIYSGRSDESLNETGFAQADHAAEQLRKFHIEALFTSPLRRTLQTSGVIGERLSLKPVVSNAFNELGMGPWEGLSEAEVELRFPAEFALWNTRPGDLKLSGRETLAEAQARAVAGVLDALSIYECSTIAIVTHVAVIRVLQLYAENRSLNDYKSIQVPNATPIQIEFDR